MAPNPNLTILREYAEKSNPSSLSNSIRLTHTENTLTVFDAFPKAVFHLLLLPRVIEPWDASELRDLRTLLRGDKDRARALLEKMDEDAQLVKKMVGEDMLDRYGFKWDVWIGFHPLPSMEHLHLHIISGDLNAAPLKTKKHYNSFHPKLGFFLHLNEVLEWFEATPTFFTAKAALSPKQYEDRLKEDLMCFRCDRAFKNMPKLKEHLKEEFDKIRAREKAKADRKRKLTASADEPVLPAKKQETEASGST